jgi:iron complex outermembrane recepter protein
MRVAHMEKSGRSTRVRTWLAGALASAVLVPAAADAQADEGPRPTRSSSDAPAAASTYSAVADLEAQAFGDRMQEAVVGVRKRQELVQEVPGSVSTLPSETLTRSNLRRIHQIQEHTPNLVYTQFGNTARLALRGIGQPQTLLVSGDSGVGLYIDGIFVARPQEQLPTLFDIESVEVLRGPQGTLFGTNSPGGAISVVTRKPTLDFGADAQLRVANFNGFESRVTLNAPLVDEQSALRLSLASVTRDGFSRNLFDGQRVDDDKELSARAQLLMLPSDDVELLLSGYYSRKNHGAPPTKCTLIAPSPGAFGAPLFEAAGGKAACAADASRDELEFASETTFARDDLDQYGGSLQASWDLGPSLRLKSLTGLRVSEPRLAIEGDGTELPFFGFANDRGRSDQRQLSQELQLLGDAWNGRLRYLGGLYFIRDEAKQVQFLRFGFLPTAAVAAVLPGSFPGIDDAQLTTAFADPFTLGVTPNPERERTLFEVDNQSYAAFGQATYALTDQLDLSVGLRLTHERKRARTERTVDGCEDGADVNPVLLQVCRSQVGRGSGLLNSVLSGFDRSARFSELSPQASLSYRVSDEMSVYGSYATGFRNGGFDLAALIPEQTDEIDPEDITSYEIGLKSIWLERRLLVKAAAFSTVQHDVRLAANLVGIGMDGDGNAGDAVLRGGELEMVLLVTERLGLSASLGALRARYSDLSAEFQRLDGERLALAPNYTMSFGVDYRVPVGSFGMLGMRTAWSHHGSQQNDPSGADQTLSNKYALLDGRLSLLLPDGKTEIAAFGTNLLDRRYFNNAAASLEFGTASRIFGPPRQYGLEILRSF